jgi:hypothetical protein
LSLERSAVRHPLIAAHADQEALARADAAHQDDERDVRETSKLIDAEVRAAALGCEPVAGGKAPTRAAVMRAFGAGVVGHSGGQLVDGEHLDAGDARAGAVAVTEGH